MGLDMYLYAKKFIWTDYENKKEQEKKLRENPLLADLVAAGITPQLRYVDVEAAYWRKANQIHHWFVENVQDGEDDCKSYYVDRDDLIKLKELCQSVLLLPSTAKDVLPRQMGYFFGDTEYGDGYFEDLRNTVAMIDECLKYPKDWDFEYRASW